MLLGMALGIVAVAAAVALAAAAYARRRAARRHATGDDARTASLPGVNAALDDGE